MTGTENGDRSHERFQRWRRMGLFKMLMKRMVDYYAKECAAGWAGDGRRWIPRTLLLLWEASKRARTPQR